MKDPVKLEGGAVIDRAAIKAVLREGGRVLIFFGGERPLVLSDNFSSEEMEELTKKSE